VSYSGNGTLTTFAYTFKVFDQDDLTVILRASDGTETVQTITTHYTVTNVGNASGGNVEFVTAPTATETVVILREQPLTQGLDLVPNDPFPAQSLEESLDKLVFMTQKHEEELGRAIKASRTNTITGSEFTISASDRANKVFAFDSSGDVSITSELGVYRGDWAASVAYNQRDIVKDTSNNNIYIANTAHTSSGTTPLSSNADIAKWDLLVDAASATASAAAAAASETAAETAQTAAEAAQTAAETAQTAAETAETNAETAQTAAEAAQASAETAYDNFDDRYLGAKSTVSGDPTTDNDGDALIDGALFFDTTNNVMKVYNLGTTTWLRTTPTSAEQTNIDTVSGISANVTTVAGISANVTTVAGVSADVTTVAGISSDVSSVGAVSTNVTTVANNITDVNNFANRYQVSASEPSPASEGLLWYDSANDIMKVYNGSSFQNAGSSVNGTSERQTYTATASQTTFAATYDSGFVDVYLNGVKLLNGTDFTATDGSSVVLSSGATVGDIVDIVAYGTFELADVYTQAQSDARYLQTVTTLGLTEPSKAVTADANGVVTFDNGISEEYTAVTSTTNATTVNLQDGTNFSHTLTENTTFTFSNPASSGKVSSFTLKIVQDASASGYTVTWPTSVDWPSATAPTLTATASAVDYFVFITHDGGTTWYGFTAGQALG
jgi:hypothetical protein